jgi:hypothetical protein
MSGGSIERAAWPDDGRTSQERWNGMKAGQQHGYVMRLERAVLNMGREIGRLRGNQTGAVKTLERIRDHADSADDPAMLAQAELDRIKGAAG